jgi:hypothetical protein
MKGSQKPKKAGKKPALKTMKERRAEKRAGARRARPLDVGSSEHPRGGTS